MERAREVGADWVSGMGDDVVGVVAFGEEGSQQALAAQAELLRHSGGQYRGCAAGAALRGGGVLGAMDWVLESVADWLGAGLASGSPLSGSSSLGVVRHRCTTQHHLPPFCDQCLCKAWRIAAELGPVSGGGRDRSKTERHDLQHRDQCRYEVWRVAARIGSGCGDGCEHSVSGHHHQQH